MRRLAGIGLVLLFLLAALPARASTSGCLSASLFELARSWLIETSLTVQGNPEPEPSPLEIGSTMDPNG